MKVAGEKRTRRLVGLSHLRILPSFIISLATPSCSFLCYVSCEFQSSRPASDCRWRQVCCKARNDDCSSSARVTSQRWKTTRDFFSVGFGDVWRKDKRSREGTSYRQAMARANGVSSFEARSLTAATGAAALDGATLTDLDGRLVVDGGVSHALLDLAGHGQEGLLNVGCILGRCLEEGNAEAVSEFLVESVSTRRMVGGAGRRCVPLRRCTQRPSCQSYRSCCQREAC
jgi:hypothetical protein